MKKPTIRKCHGLEYSIQSEIVKFLRVRGWHIERLAGGVMRGGATQSGLPDLLICHVKYGVRFVEVKQEHHYRFTVAQKWKLPVLMDNGCGVWILTEATEEQYERLFKEPNLWDYLKPSERINKQTIENIFEELLDG